MFSFKRVIVGLLKFFIILLSLITLSVISSLITMKLVSRADLVKIPSVVGKDTVYALEQLNKVGLRMKILGQEFSELIPESHVISQEPKPNELIRRDRAVKIILSKGAEKVDVPNIVDEPWLRAQNLIQKAGLKIGRLARTYNEDIALNRVIAQNPPGNSMVPRGAMIDLLISDGRPVKYYIMPELKGLSLSYALKRLNGMDIYPGRIEYKYDVDVPSNTVLSQGIPHGFRVASGKKIDLEVSREQKADEEAGIYKTLQYQVPYGLENREVMIVLKEGDEMREIFHQMCSPSENIDLLIKTSRNTKAMIYLDNELIEERQF